MKFGSLFSGIGGLDLGLERAGLECAFQVENEPYCLKVLAKHWPNVTRYEDIREVDFERVEPVELLAGGFPCQDLSYAGKGAGLSGERSGLWSEFIRAIRVVRPRYVLVENVPGLLGRGMGVVLRDLCALGYDAEWESVPAAAFGAPHLRWRVFIVAFTNSEYGRGLQRTDDQPRHDPTFQGNGTVVHPEQVGRRGLPDATGRNNAHGQEAGWEEGAGRLEQCGEDVAHPGRQRDERWGEAGDLPCSPGEAQREGLQRQRSGDSTLDSGSDVADANGNNQQWRGGSVQVGRLGCAFKTAPDRNAGRTQWAVEPDVGRVANGVPNRIHRLRGLGNAVVPQVAQWLGERIIEHELSEDVA